MGFHAKLFKFWNQKAQEHGCDSGLTERKRWKIASHGESNGASKDSCQAGHQSRRS